MLEIEGLEKRFGATHALRGMTFSVEPGSMFGFVGSNGAGKTTTMRIVLGVMQADAGTVSWAGRPLDLPARRRIGYMPEERGLYPKMRVQEQLRYLAEAHGLSSARAKASAALWIKRLDIEQYASSDLQKLSLGNQQRVQLAAALVHDPAVLVLDEPFSGLDPLAVDVMSQVLTEQAEGGVAVLFSSHQLDLVERLCHRVGIVAKGRMVANGTVDGLKASGPLLVEIDVDAVDDTWLSNIDGVTVQHRDGHRRVLASEKALDDQQLLHAAMQAGVVSHYAHRQRSLSELFRDVVADDAAPAVETVAS